MTVKGAKSNRFSTKCRLITALLVSALLLPGCGHGIVPEMSAGTSETAVTAGQISISYVFDQHAYPAILEDCCPEEYRDSFFNLCDALCEGKDTFECSNKEAYAFCMDPETLNQLYPAACGQISAGDRAFENGTGHIRYEKSAGEFMERQKAFQNDISALINRYIKPDYTDFEKCLVLYDYMTSEYQFDHIDEVRQFDGGTVYSCFELKKGICSDLSALYAYLLMECGVDAVAVENAGAQTGAGYHAWTYVRLGGEGFHIDVSSALKDETGLPGSLMDYFMMTDTDRSSYGGYISEETQIPLISGGSAKDLTISSGNTKYRLPEWSYCTGHDTDRNIIYYTDSNGDHEFIYE